jgi:hypothetical protein
MVSDNSGFDCRSAGASVVSLALFGAVLIPSQELVIFGGVIRPGFKQGGIKFCF